MKRLLALILSLMMIISGAALAEAGNDEKDALIVGSTTRLSGDFFAGLWSSNTADIDVRTLLHDGSTVAWMNDGNYNVNKTALISDQVTTDAEGNQTHVFTLQPELKFSDGSPIEAKDYVFSVLLLSAPAIRELGAANTQYSDLVGWENFASGEGPFTGVRLLSDNSFSLTIKGKSLPYFYSLALVNVTPYPVAVIAPGCTVEDQGEGAFIGGDMTAALLQETLLNPETGYATYPSVVSGAYMLTSFNEETGTAEFARNPYYMGNFEGQKPSIEKLIFKEVKNETLISEIQNGTVDLVNKVSNIQAINQGMEAGLNFVGYPRMGLAYLAIACEKEPGSSNLMRWAIASCIDKDALVEECLGEYGRPVYSYYGIGQWMAVKNFHALKDLEIRGYDLDSAKWYVNKAGYAGTTLKMAIPQDNAVADALVKQLENSFEKVGLKLEVTELPMNVLLQHYYRQLDRTYDLFFLASNFNHVFDPYFTYHTDDIYQGVWNRSGLKDEQLMELAEQLRQVDPGNQVSYRTRWMNFQKYWAEVLPAVPLYSNYYIDFHSDRVQNYQIDSYSTWASAILYAEVK